MATWIAAQQRRTLATFEDSLGIGSMTTLSVASADYYAALRCMAYSSLGSFQIVAQWGQSSGTWLVSTAIAFGPGSGRTLELPTWGRDALFTVTMGASASMFRTFIHAVPIA